jgi:hypothetical protein
MPSFVEQYPISLTLEMELNLRMKQGLKDQTRPQRQGEFLDNSNNLLLLLFTYMTFVHLSL